MNLQKPLARLVTRPSNNEGTECDLIIGSALKGQSALKPNSVYEVHKSFLTGSITLVLVGESMVATESKGGWAHAIQDLMGRLGSFLFWTKKEYLSFLNEEK